MRVLLALFTLHFSLCTGHCADWSQFRGPNGSGVGTETGLPTNWSMAAGVKWKTTLPARGVSSPVVAGDKVYVTCSSGAKDDRLHVLAFDLRSGKPLWHRQFAATGGTNCHPMTCMAAPTPAADASGVYALFATGDVAALDADGSLRWYRSIVGDYPTVTNQVGMASSPVLYKDRLIVPMDNAGESFLAAFDTRTGKNVWKTPRKRDVNWATPVLRPLGEKAEVLFPGVGELVAYDADTGAKTWTFKGVGGGIPSPTVADGLVYVPARGVAALKPKGDTAEQVWTSPKLTSGMSSPLVYDGVVYAASAGVLKAADAKTGKELWSERFKGNGKASASPVAADGKVFVTDEAGTTTVYKAGSSVEELGVGKLGEETLATPAIAGGCILFRTDKGLYCVGW